MEYIAVAHDYPNLKKIKLYCKVTEGSAFCFSKEMADYGHIKD